MSRETMTRKFLPPSVLSIVAVLAVGAVALFAQPGEQPPMAQQGMHDQQAMEQDFMTMRQQMQERMQTMNRELDRLVADMQSARGKEKTEAMAAVITELVEQRKTMGSMMMTSQPRMMIHMMEHMAQGLMNGMNQSMNDCPMMSEMPSMGGQHGGKSKHPAHHPEN